MNKYNITTPTIKVTFNNQLDNLIEYLYDLINIYCNNIDIKKFQRNVKAEINGIEVKIRNADIKTCELYNFQLEFLTNLICTNSNDNYIFSSIPVDINEEEYLYVKYIFESLCIDSCSHSYYQL